MRCIPSIGVAARCCTWSVLCGVLLCQNVNKLLFWRQHKQPRCLFIGGQQNFRRIGNFNDKCTKSDSASTLWCQFARSFCHSACLLQLLQRKTPENWRVSISPKSRISYHSKFHTINDYLRFRLLGFFFELV